MGLCINTTKTETMCIGSSADFFIDGTKLANVTRFKYLGSYVTNDCSMKEELASCTQVTSYAFGCLRKILFDLHDITIQTKIKVYNQCLKPILVYGSEIWTLYQHQVWKLHTIQQRHLHLILKIKWDHFVSNEEVLRRAGVQDIELKLVGNCLRWLGHICTMDGNRPVKALLHSELFHGSWLVGWPNLRFKDTCKNALKCGQVLDLWKTVVDNRQEWRRLVRTVSESYDIKKDERGGKMQRGEKTRQVITLSFSRTVLCYIRFLFGFLGVLSLFTHKKLPISSEPAYVFMQ